MAIVIDICPLAADLYITKWEYCNHMYTLYTSILSNDDSTIHLVLESNTYSFVWLRGDVYNFKVVLVLNAAVAVLHMVHIHMHLCAS